MKKLSKEQLRQLTKNSLGQILKEGLDELCRLQEQCDHSSIKMHCHTFVPMMTLGLFQNRSQVLKHTLATDQLLTNIVELQVYLSKVSSIFNDDNTSVFSEEARNMARSMIESHKKSL